LKWHEHSSIRTFIASDTFISKPDHCGKSLHVRKSISLVIKWEGIGLWWDAHAIIWKRITIINHSFLPYMNYSYWFFFLFFYNTGDWTQSYYLLCKHSTCEPCT
jgi:hypothetical protein